MVAGLSDKNKAVYALIKFEEIVMVNNGKNESLFTMELENLVVNDKINHSFISNKNISQTLYQT